MGFRSAELAMFHGCCASTMLKRYLRARFLALCGLILLAVSGAASANVEIIGTPAATGTVRQWGKTFTSETNVEVAYVEALEEVSTAELFVGIYDLAVVEYPMTTTRLSEQGLVQFPLLGVGVAVVVNLPGVTSNTIRLDAHALAAIYLGQINYWNDPLIAALNPNLSLPAIPVVPIAQSDGSAVTLNFTRYVASGSDTWRNKVGLGSGLIWPLGVGERDASAAAKKLMAQEGAIGFQSWETLTNLGLNTVQLKNARGEFVSPTPERFANTFRLFLSKPYMDFDTPVNVDDTDAWPILGVIYGQMKLIPEDVPDALETIQMLTQVLKKPMPSALNGQIPVTYPDIAPAITQIQTSKRFGPPQKKMGGM